MSFVKQIFLFAGLFLSSWLTRAQSGQVGSAQLELIHKREMYSKVFLQENGDHQVVISPAPVHYVKNGKWEDINPNLVSTGEGFANKTNVLQSWFPASVSNNHKIKLLVNLSDEVFIHSKKKLVVMTNQMELSILAFNVDNAIASASDNRLQYRSIYKNVTDEYTVLNGQIKNNVILSSVPEIIENISSGYFGFQETIELPEGWKMNNADGLTSAAIDILDVNGNAVLTIPAPVFFDANGLKSDGSAMTEGKYLVRHENNLWILTTLVPVEWLKNENTSYPVSIDPTITIAGTTGGWQSPNNWVDNPSFVFLGVCCSNLTHRAWIKFNTSAIPDNQCITLTELQVNVITVVATTPELVHVNDVTGAFGPYGGIIPAAYTDFGNGYYTSFTINGTGVYGYYTLGLAANTLLQSQLPGNWFQVGMMLDNEPSTNYKIINGTSSNLRVTYTNCTLPTELTAFNATCSNNRVNITWESASQRNNDYFTLERTTNGTDYKTVGIISGAGNSSQSLYYSFVDEDPLDGTSYYILKQTDFNGQTQILHTATVHCGNTEELNVYPNPGKGLFTIEGAKTGNQIVVTDVIGQVVYQSIVTEGKNQIDLSKRLDGIYFVQVVSAKGISSKKIILYK